MPNNKYKFSESKAFIDFITHKEDMTNPNKIILLIVFAIKLLNSFKPNSDRWMLEKASKGMVRPYPKRILRVRVRDIRNPNLAPPLIVE